MAVNRGIQQLEKFARQRWLPGFRWAVGREFADALRLCAFQEGDVFYADRRAYDGWRGTAKASPFIQVARSDARLDGGRFESNWSKELTAAVYDGDDRPAYIDTTQGALYRMLHSGLDILEDPETNPMIGLGKDVRRHLRSCKETSCQFLVPFDSVRWPSYWKVWKICRALNVPMELKRLNEIVDMPRHRPTLMVAAFDCFPMSRDQVTETVKEAINPETKHFKLAIHGHYV